MRTTLIALAAAAALSTAPATAQQANQGASQPYFRCEITGRIANFVVSAGDFRQGIPPKLGNNQCAAPGASCQWAKGVLTLIEQADGKPLMRIFDTVKGVYTTRYNGQDKPSTCIKVPPVSATPGPASVAQNNGAPSSSGMYYVCTYSYYKTQYVSGVSCPNDAADALTKITAAFANYVKAKYSLGNAGSASCVYKFSAADAQALVSQFAKPSGDGTPVPTGWKYGDASANSTAATSPVPPTAAAATTTAGAPASGGAYWLCMLAAGDATYYSDVFATPAGTTLGNVVNGFRQFIVSKYNLANALPPRCFNYGASQQQAQSGLQGMTAQSGKNVMTGWKY